MLYYSTITIEIMVNKRMYCDDHIVNCICMVTTGLYGFYSSSSLPLTETKQEATRQSRIWMALLDTWAELRLLLLR